MELTYRCGRCGKDGDFSIWTAPDVSSEAPRVKITCKCGRSVGAMEIDTAWRRVSEPDRPPAPTIQDAYSIPCQEPDEDGKGPPGHHFWGGPQSRPGFMKCPYCGLEARDEA